MGGAAVDLSQRLHRSGTVVGSPAAAAETIICQIAIPDDLVVTKGVFLSGYCAFTAGTNGVSAGLKIRQTSVAGTIIQNSGLVTVVAASLYDRAIVGFDATQIAAGAIYCLTLIITSGSAASTVSAAELQAFVV